MPNPDPTLEGPRHPPGIYGWNEIPERFKLVRGKRPGEWVWPGEHLKEREDECAATARS
jgi:hypothetical protein